MISNIIIILSAILGSLWTFAVYRFGYVSGRADEAAERDGFK